MFRSCLLSAALVATASFSSMAAEPPADGAVEAPYIQTSYLIAPRQVGDFVLAAANYDPAEKYAGAGFGYQLPAQPQIKLDVYVYPAGRMAQAQAVSEGTTEFVASLRQAAKQGTFGDLQVVQQSEFALPPPSVASRPPQNAVDAAVIQASAQAEQVTGQKLELELQYPGQDTPMRSNGYLFYKQLHYFKVRASAPKGELSRERFNAVTDHAARTLVPALRAANVGSCAQFTFQVPQGANEVALATAVATQLSQASALGCYGSADRAGIDAVRDSAQVIEISYSADEWKSQ